MRRSPRCRSAIDQLMLVIPVFGKILRKSIIANITRTTSTTLAAGIPLLSALTSATRVTSNTVFQHALQQAIKDVTLGIQLHQALESTRQFPRMVTQMIAVGEESGALDEMLDKIATYYEEDVDQLVSTLSNLLEPIIMIVLGGLVGGFVLAMYMPIFKLGSIF